MGCLAIQRLSHKLYKFRGGVFAYALKAFNRVIYACDIAYQTDIPKSCRFPHQGLGVVIHPAAVIGEDCVICQNVTIGQSATGDQIKEGGYSRGAPVLGKNVTVFAGAILLGGITVGDNSIIAAGAVVLSDVPAGAVAAGVPAEMKKRR